MKERLHKLIEKRLLSRRAELRERLAALREDVRHENDPLSLDWGEEAVQQASDEVLVSKETRAQAELREIERALRRLEEGTYGVCDVCGDPIPYGRLYSLPQTERCSDCRNS